MLGLLLISILGNALPAFTQAYVALDITFSAETLDPEGSRDPDTLRRADYHKQRADRHNRHNPNSGLVRAYHNRSAGGTLGFQGGEFVTTTNGLVESPTW